MSYSFIHRILLTALILMPASNAYSKEISFDYLQTVFTSGTIDPGGSLNEIDGNGFGFSLSLSINTHLAFSLLVITTNFETFQGMNNLDTSTITGVGVTAHKTIAPATELFANLSAVMAEITASDATGSVSDDDLGAVFSIGLRHLITDRIELELTASDTYVFDNNAISYGMEARYYFRQALSVGFGYITSENTDSLLLNARLDI